MLTASFLRQLETILGNRIKKKIHFRRVKPLSGGSINQTARVDTTAGVFFLKANDAFRYPGMFQKEAAGLEILRETKTFTIPKVILAGEEEDQAFLILEFIDSKAQRPDFWEQFGIKLAALHRNTNERFGLIEDNYIGSLEQKNKQHNNWLDFFIEQRLEPQLKFALSNGRMNENDVASFKNLYMRLDTIIPVEQPSLLHGDLWSGNYLPGDSGEPCLIDPAIYYGHREMDLSMTRLFGGFDDRFYQAYNDNFSLQPGFDERVDIHNLYPLMVHVNLFGGSYIMQVRSILKRFQ